MFMTITGVPVGLFRGRPSVRVATTCTLVLPAVIVSMLLVIAEPFDEVMEWIFVFVPLVILAVLAIFLWMGRSREPATRENAPGGEDPLPSTNMVWWRVLAVAGVIGLVGPVLFGVVNALILMGDTLGVEPDRVRRLMEVVFMISVPILLISFVQVVGVVTMMLESVPHIRDRRRDDLDDQMDPIPIVSRMREGRP